MRNLRTATLMIVAVLLGASSGIAAAQAAQAPSASVASPSGATSAAAQKLGQLLFPEDQAIAIARHGFELGVDNTIKSKAADAAVYAANPGLREVVIDAAWPVARKQIVARIPANQQMYADFFVQHFSPEEIGQLLAFYSSPTGSKILSRMFGRLSSIAHPEATTTAEGINTVTQSATNDVLATLDADDLKVLFTFAGTPAGQKLKAVQADLQQLAVEVAREQASPEARAEVRQAVESAVKQYLADKKAAAKP